MIQWNKYLNLSPSKKNKLLLWVAGAFFFWALFIKFTLEVFEDQKIQNIDQSILQYIGTHLRSPLFNGAVVDITSLGSPSLITLVALIAIGTLLIAKDRIGALYLFLAISGGTLWTAIIKKFMARPRPQIISHLVEVQGQSYPSGHTLVATITYLALALLVCRHLKSYKVILLVLTTAFAIILLIAFSRLYLGVHYPSDVLSGLLFGISWVLMLTAFFKIFTYKNYSTRD